MEEEEKEEEEEEEVGAVFDKPDSRTQTHAQRESYCLDCGGFSIQRCVCKCHLIFCPNTLLNLSAVVWILFSLLAS